MLQSSPCSVINHDQHQVLHTLRCISASPTSLLHSLLLYHQPNEMLGCELEKQDSLKQMAIAGCECHTAIASIACALSLPSPVVCLLSAQRGTAFSLTLLAGPSCGNSSCQQNKNDFFFLPVSLGYVTEKGVAAVLFGSAAPARFCQNAAISSGASFFSCFQPVQLC